MKNENRKTYILLIVGTLLIFFLGFASNEVYVDWKNERTLNGLYLSNVDNKSGAEEYAYSADDKGDWVCINVAYDMPYELAYTTCVHECSHKAFSEIYAERCASDPIKCMEFLNEE